MKKLKMSGAKICGRSGLGHVIDSEFNEIRVQFLKSGILINESLWILSSEVLALRSNVEKTGQILIGMNSE